MENRTLTYLPVAEIFPHPDNPRKDLGDLTELAESIRANGILQNLTVVPRDSGWTVIIGHRRLGAARLAGLEQVPCVVAEMSGREQISTMLTENMQRRDLTPYEQAASFAQLLDFGMSVEEIADKSGFSPATVRRRVKMAELDRDTLKAVSERQINLADFDELAKIEDLTRRNEVLSKIGTRDFDISVKQAIREQEINKNLPRVQAALKAVGAKRLKDYERYSSKFEPVNGEKVFVQEWQEGCIPKVDSKLYYYIQNWDGRVYFCTERKRAKPEKKSKAEKAREQAVTEAWAELKWAATLAHELREAFVDRLSYNPKNADKILRGALFAGAWRAVRYVHTDREGICALLNIEQEYGSIASVRFAEELPKLSQRYIPQLVYKLFGDSEKDLCVRSEYRKDFPAFAQDGRLMLLYEWLQSLGYEMSTEEQQLMDGSHAAYHRKI